MTNLPKFNLTNLKNFSTDQTEFSSVEDHADVGVLEVVTLVAAGVGPRNFAQKISLKKWNFNCF